MQTRFFFRDPAAPKPNRPLGVGALALIERDNTLLLECRSDCGRWGLIGGALDLDESLDMALRREVFEETGLLVRGYRLFGTFSDPTRIFQYPDGNIVRVLSLVYWVEVEDFSTLCCSEESTELRFFTPGELRDLDIVETGRHVIDRYLAGESLVLE
jgi:8-oxo-dGTP pyrophosphatase MutT (NUDIX family)